MEATFVDHTVPCLAFALIEEPGVCRDPDRLAQVRCCRPLGCGGAVAIAAQAPADTPVAVPNLSGTLPGRAEGAHFVETPGCASPRAYGWPRRRRLYCDSFYANSEVAPAEKHRHMTATQAALFARDAGVHELVLIHFAARYNGRYEMLVEEARAIFPNTTAEIPPSGNKKSDRDANHS